MLSRSSQTHYRTRLNTRKQYRTYTYSESGYRKLLSDAGFAEMSSYWADPGYNQPYHLIPFAAKRWVRQHSEDLLDHPGRAPRRSWRRRLKKLALPVSSWLLPDFVLVASKQPGKTKVQTWVEDRLAEADQEETQKLREVPRSAYVGAARPIPRSTKLRSFGWEMRTESDLAYLKIFTGTQENGTHFETETANRGKVQESLNISAVEHIRVPRPYGTLQIWNTSYYLESASRGSRNQRTGARARLF